MGPSAREEHLRKPDQHSIACAFWEQKGVCFFLLNDSCVILNRPAYTIRRGIVSLQIFILNHSAALESVCPTHLVERMWARAHDLGYKVSSKTVAFI